MTLTEMSAVISAWLRDATADGRSVRDACAGIMISCTWQTPRPSPS